MTTVAFDFDGTWTRLPGILRALVVLLQDAGHVAVLVTGRSDEGHYGAEVRDAVGAFMPIVFAGDGWKRAAALAAGFRVDVWIDDWPEYVAPQLLLDVVARRQGASVPPHYTPGTVRVTFGDGTTADLPEDRAAAPARTREERERGFEPAIRRLGGMRGEVAFVEVVPGRDFVSCAVECMSDTLLRAEAEIRRLRGET